MKPNDIVHLSETGPVKLIPDICIAGTKGSRIHSGIKQNPDDTVLIYGHNPIVDNCIFLY